MRFGGGECCEKHINMTTKYKVITDFRITDYGFRISDSILQISDYGFRITDYGFRFGSVVRSVGCTVNVTKKPSKINK